MAGISLMIYFFIYPKKLLYLSQIVAKGYQNRDGDKMGHYRLAKREKAPQAFSILLVYLKISKQFYKSFMLMRELRFARIDYGTQ